MNTTKEFALNLDNNDVLKDFREQFFIPQHKNKDSLYFTGNSLGLQPKCAEQYIQTELQDWKNLGVEGHFHAKRPWMKYHHFFSKQTAELVGANEHEVVVMNNLSVNLHLLLVSFYRPKPHKYKILMEAGAFPSDQYVIESQLKFHGYDYDEACIEMKPRAGEYALRTEDILKSIEDNKDELALIFFSGVQYYTGQKFDMEKISQKAKECQITLGLDLAHAAGNVPLKLHKWGVDFAAWCTYKYLNSGPGSVSGAFIHEKHSLNPETPRFAAWWGYKEDKRFLMQRGFEPELGAQGWQLSNAPVFNMVIHKASLDIFEQAGLENIYAKGKQLNNYLEFLILEAEKQNAQLEFKIITPKERGCQLSLLTNENGKHLFDYLSDNGVYADWREPNVIRLAPVPLYNSFEDIFQFYQLLLNY